MKPDEAEQVVDRLHKRLSSRRTEVAKLDRYFRGEQPLEYASPQWKQFHQDRYKDFSDNWCGVVGNAPAERIRVNGFRIGADTDPISEDERALWRDWNLNELDAQSSQGFLATIVKKRSAVLVWGNDSTGDPVVTWEDPSQVIVDYDPAQPMRRRYALKTWTDGDRQYATLYTPDELWKFSKPVSSLEVVSSMSAWQPREIVGETWPLRNRLGVVPIVEFPNRPMLGGEPISDIAGTTAMQDAINLLWAYLFTAADHASMPARVVMGQEPPKIPILDDAGQKIGEKPIELQELAQGRLLWLTGQKVSIGQWDAAKLDVFTGTINVAVRHVAAQTRTPVHYVVGELNNINGETLIAAEAGLVKKVEEFQLFGSPNVREVFRLIALVRNNKAVAEACRLGTVQWANAETRSHTQMADALLKWRDIGFPFAYIAEMAGKSQTEIDRIMRMREAEADDPTMARLLREINRTPAEA